MTVAVFSHEYIFGLHDMQCCWKEAVNGVPAFRRSLVPTINERSDSKGKGCSGIRVRFFSNLKGFLQQQDKV